MFGRYTEGSSRPDDLGQRFLSAACHFALIRFTTISRSASDSEDRGKSRPPEKVQALIAGLHTLFDDLREQVVYELTCALITRRIVPEGPFKRAVKTSGL